MCAETYRWWTLKQSTFNYKDMNSSDTKSKNTPFESTIAQIALGGIAFVIVGFITLPDGFHVPVFFLAAGTQVLKYCNRALERDSKRSGTGSTTTTT